MLILKAFASYNKTELNNHLEIDIVDAKYYFCLRS